VTGTRPPVDADQAELRALIDALAADHDVDLSDERPDEVAALRRQLARLGLWTVGVAAELGGGGADTLLSATAFAGLGRRWTALGWGAVQAHAAVEVLAGHAQWSGLVTAIHAGEAAVAVVDAHSTGVRLAGKADYITGTIARIDPAGPDPHVVVLVGDGTAWVLPPTSLETQAVRGCGLGGAMTVSVTTVHAVEAESVIRPVAADSARIRLRLGAAAVAAGIADAAAAAALSYAAHRRQFGTPLIRLPAVRESLFASSGAAALLFRQVARGETAAGWQAAAVLDAACESAIDVAARSLQSHGGYGYMTDYPVERLLRDAISLRAACDLAAARRDGATDLAARSS
jgi:alkylation response protein AidB-like acyl-CoA dehydrogenase